MQSEIRVLALPSIFDAGRDRRDIRVMPGTSLAEMVSAAMPEANGAHRDRLRILIGDHVVLRQHWHCVRPKAGTHVLIHAVPGDEGLLRNVLTIAVTVGALALGQFYAPGLSALTSGFLSTGASSALITGGTPNAGLALLNLMGRPS